MSTSDVTLKPNSVVDREQLRDTVPIDIANTRFALGAPDQTTRFSPFWDSSAVMDAPKRLTAMVDVARHVIAYVEAEERPIPLLALESKSTVDWVRTYLKASGPPPLVPRMLLTTASAANAAAGSS